MSCLLSLNNKCLSITAWATVMSPLVEFLGALNPNAKFWMQGRSVKPVRAHSLFGGLEQLPKTNVRRAWWNTRQNRRSLMRDKNISTVKQSFFQTFYQIINTNRQPLAFLLRGLRVCYDRKHQRMTTNRLFTFLFTFMPHGPSSSKDPVFVVIARSTSIIQLLRNKRLPRLAPRNSRSYFPVDRSSVFSQNNQSSKTMRKVDIFYLPCT